MASSEVRGSSRQIGVSRRGREAGVAEQVGRAEGLLEARQAHRVELVELRIALVEGAVGVGLQGHRVTDVVAQPLEVTSGTAGGDLHPEARRAGLQRLVGLGEEVVRLLVEPEGGAGGDSGGGGTEPRPERAIGRSELGVEHRQLQGGPGHRVAAHRVEVGPEGHRVAGRARAGPREEVVAEHHQRGVGELRRVGGFRLDRALGPTVGLRGAHVHQEHVPARAGASGAAQRGREPHRHRRRARSPPREPEGAHRAQARAHGGTDTLRPRDRSLHSRPWRAEGQRPVLVRERQEVQAVPQDRERQHPPGPRQPHAFGAAGDRPAPVRRVGHAGAPAREPRPEPRCHPADARGGQGGGRGAGPHRRGGASRASPPTSSTPSATRPASSEGATRARSTTTASPSRSAPR